MIFRNNFFHKLHHIWNVDLAGKVFKAGNNKLGILEVIFPNLGNADAVVERRKGVFIVGKNLFVKLFAWAQAGIFNLDILVWSKAS